MDVDVLRPGFTYLLLERVDRGRKGGHRRMMAPEPYPSLDEAWPAIRTILRCRLRNGYRIVGPVGQKELLHLPLFEDGA